MTTGARQQLMLEIIHAAAMPANISDIASPRLMMSSRPLRRDFLSSCAGALAICPRQ